ncbi:LysR family transcriptional regulator [Thermoleophilia bacterium SCSIO 60948]|nr:LysR family transcriptional regulator [Thermoleophilia bacterium SCSIO 60948]
MAVELRHLRSFLAVADELNFTRAAERIHLTQQALSGHVAQLEAMLGARLLVRTTRRVELTPAGELLVARIRPAVEALDAGLGAVARSVGSGRISLGLSATAPLALTPRLLRAFAAAHPEVEVSIHNTGFDDPSAGLRSGEADVSLTWLPFSSEGIVCRPLLEDERVAVLAADHPLASLDRIEVAELAVEPVVWIEDMDPVARDFWTLAEHRGGRPPRVGAQITGFEDLFTAVRAGRAVAASPASIVGGLPYSDLAIRAVDGLEPAVAAICHRAEETSPYVAELVRLAVELAETEGSDASR